MESVHIRSRPALPGAPAPKRAHTQKSPNQAPSSDTDRIDTSGLRLLSEVAESDAKRPSQDFKHQVALNHWYKREFGHARRLFNELGTADAKFKLGVMHAGGQGGQVDYAEARRLFVESGTSDAKNDLGAMYHKGRGGPVDHAEARRLYAESGTVNAKNNLGVMHLNGLGGPVNYAQARKLFAEAGTADSKSNLAIMHANGFGGPVNSAEAQRLNAESALDSYLTTFAGLSAAKQFRVKSKGANVHESDQEFFQSIAGPPSPVSERLDRVQTMLLNIVDGKAAMAPPALMKLLAISRELTASASADASQKAALLDLFSQAAAHTL